MSKPTIVVCDVGARGCFHERWTAIGDRLHAIAIDADADAPIKRFDSHGWEVLRTALWSEERDLSLNLTRTPACSSVFEPNTAFLKRFPDAGRFDVMERRSIAARPLNTIDHRPHFLKIDAQGAELAILQGAGELLDHVIGIEVEVAFAPLYVDAPLFVDVDRFLRIHDFELCDLNRFYWRDSSSSMMRCVFADALYFKRPSLVTEKEIAATLASVYSITLRQSLGHAFQWLSRYLRRDRFYDADMQLGH
jgi:FkbM family methyltransferase